MPQGQPIVWRGPLVGGAIQQFLRDVDWGELDYLVIDLPPGTSDAQLTLAQSVPISGAVLVTTPQDVALLDVDKALAMFRRLSVPVIGLVENMSAFICPHCGEATEIFGRGGGERFCREQGMEFLGGIPLDVKVRQGADAGVPAVAQREPGPAPRRHARPGPHGRGAHERARGASGAGPEHQLRTRSRRRSQEIDQDPGLHRSRSVRRAGSERFWYIMARGRSGGSIGRSGAPRRRPISDR